MCFYVYIFKTEYTNWGGKISEDHIEFFFGLMWYPAVAFFLTFTSCHPMQGTTVHALTQFKETEGQNMKTIFYSLTVRFLLSIFMQIHSKYSVSFYIVFENTASYTASYSVSPSQISAHPS